MSVEIPELLAPKRNPAALAQATAAGGRSVASFADLMRLHDDDFVKAAYPVLLGRKADPLGLNHYTQRLRQGRSRVSIVDQMVRSPEVKHGWEEFPGLRNAVERFRKSRRLSGWKLAWRDPELGRLPGHARARALANAFGAQQQVMLAAIDRLASRQQISERMLLELLENGPASPLPANPPVELAGKKTKAETQPLRRRQMTDVRELPSAYRSLLDALRF